VNTAGVVVFAVVSKVLTPNWALGGLMRIKIT
jgi:hypothetical protein